jgi:hypothetical protein
MANFKMNPGSKEKDTPGGTSEKQSDTIRKLNRNQISKDRKAPEKNRKRKKKLATRGAATATAAIAERDSIIKVAKKNVERTGGPFNSERVRREVRRIQVEASRKKISKKSGKRINRQ